MGNAQPSDDLGSWFRVNHELPYDLIAVGVQESFYKVDGADNASETSKNGLCPGKSICHLQGRASRAGVLLK